MKLGVYVGSFNPVHKGHIKVAKYLLDNNYLDKIMLIPTPNYWNKQDLVDIKKRIEMLKFFESNNLIVDSTHNYQYTYQILNALEKENPCDDLYLIIGSDNLEKFHLWKNIDQILKHHVIVLRRGYRDIEEPLKKFDRSRFIVINDFPFIDVSSTEIRNSLDNENLDGRVLKYIKENKLYVNS